jgi:transcriptional regulator with XRE-family HTH domain
MDIPAFPFCHLRLVVPKPAGKSYPAELRTVGDHLKKRRLDLGLRQKDVARELGANFKTYENWEQGKYEPELRFFPAIISFLGYDPTPEPTSLPERILAARRREGISQKELARKLGLDSSTVAAWEAGTVRKPFARFVRLFEEYVEGVPGAAYS